MGNAADKEHFFVMNWEIANFSYWNSEIHDKVIETQSFCLPSGTPLKLELFPRGLSGGEDRILVRVHGIQDGLSGDLSFFGSKEYCIMDKKKINMEKKGTFYELPLGPKFEEIVELARIHERYSKDQFIVQFRMKHSHDEEHRMFTKIDVFDTSVKISSKVFKNLDLSSATVVTKFEHALDDGKKGSMTLWAAKDKLDGSKIELALESKSFEASVLTRTFVLDNENKEVKEEENKHLFREDGEKWIISNSLKLKKLKEKGFSVFIRVKIVPKHKYKHQCGTLSCYPNGVVSAPTASFRLLDFDIPGEDLPERKPPVDDQKEEFQVLIKEFKNLYDDPEFSDIQLRSSDAVTFKAHRAILSTRSPVFSNLIGENTSGDTLDIQDMDGSTLGSFLSFLYTGMVGNLSYESAFKLYSAAGTYQVPTLREKCSNVLKDNITISNVKDILTLSRMVNDFDLKYSAETFVLQNKEHFQRDLDDGTICLAIHCYRKYDIPTTTF